MKKLSAQEKINLLEKLYQINASLDWMESYRQTYKIPVGRGLPSGLIISEVYTSLTRSILRGERVVIIQTMRYES